MAYFSDCFYEKKLFYFEKSAELCFPEKHPFPGGIIKEMAWPCPGPCGDRARDPRVHLDPPCGGLWLCLSHARFFINTLEVISGLDESSPEINKKLFPMEMFSLYNIILKPTFQRIFPAFSGFKGVNEGSI